MQIPSPTFIRTDADGLAELEGVTDPAFLILEISRAEIESKNFTSALERLLVVANSRESTLSYRESLILMIHGYEADRRELPEIPDVRSYFALLTKEWPHWLWFLSREQGGIDLFMSLLCDVRIHRRAGQFGIEFTDLQQMQNQFGDLLERGIALFEAYDISPALAEQSAQSAVQALLGS